MAPSWPAPSPSRPGVRLSRSSSILTGTRSCSSSYQSLVTAWVVTWICAAPLAAPVRVSALPASSRVPSSPSNELNGHTLRKILNLEPIPSRKSSFCSTWIDEVKLTCPSLHLHSTTAGSFLPIESRDRKISTHRNWSSRLIDIGQGSAGKSKIFVRLLKPPSNFRKLHSQSLL